MLTIEHVEATKKIYKHVDVSGLSWQKFKKSIVVELRFLHA